MAEVVISGATIITMDPSRTVIRDGAVAINGDRVTAVGPAGDLRIAPGTRVIDGRQCVVLPGLVDLHAKIGHAVLRSVGEHLEGPALRNLWDDVACRFATERYYYVDAQLGAAEKLLNGCTAIVSSPGAAQSRMGNLAYVKQAQRAIEDIGLRTRMIAGIGRAPWPQQHADYAGGARVQREVTFDQSLDNIESIIAESKRNPSPLVDYCTGSSRMGNVNPMDPMYSRDQQRYLRTQVERLRHIMDTYEVGFFSNAYGNAIEFAHDEQLGVLSPKTILSHGTGLSDRAIEILAETGTKISHNPRARRLYEFAEPCRVVEMIERGVVVGLGSDGPAPDRACDPWSTMQAAMRHQRERFHSPAFLPPGKALEMATIDGYRALGLDDRLGSIEAGKLADVIVVDLFEPNLWPAGSPVQQVAYFANGRNVRHVFVNGRHVVDDGKLTSIDVPALLEEAAGELERLLSIPELHLQELADAPAGFGKARYAG